jgi:hypothetical protein
MLARRNDCPPCNGTYLLYFYIRTTLLHSNTPCKNPIIHNVSNHRVIDKILFCNKVYNIKFILIIFTQGIKLINYRGVTPVYVPAMWVIIVPQKIQLFFWLLSHNKLASVDNLNRKSMAKPVECCFVMEVRA